MILKGCGYVFCNSCVDDWLVNWMCKCLSCNKVFDWFDVMVVYF